MKKTQRFIVVLGEESLTASAIKVIAGFKACTVIKAVSAEILDNVYHYNKNAVYFCQTYDLKKWSKFKPLVIKLTRGKTETSKGLMSVRSIMRDFPKMMDSCDVDVGDHTSQDSKGVVTHNEDKCLLCNILRGKTEKVEHIVYQTDNFYVVPGTGAFFEGYLMIVPKRHVMSFANLTCTELEEFYTVLNDIRTILEGIYHKKVFAFECGSGRTGAGKHETSIVHAHFHLAPTKMPVLKEVQKSGLNPALIQKEELEQYGESPYMLYVDQEDNWFISSNPQEYYPRQHPRQVLAEYMGCYELYNWRIHPFRERMDVIANEFREFCWNHFNELPVWVQESIQFQD